MDTREKLLKSGEKELLRTGAGTLSLREIARGLNLSNMAAYRHFTSKEAFLAALADRSLKKLSDTLQKSATAPLQGSHDELLKVAQAYFKFSRDKPHVFKLLFNGELARETETGEDQNYSDIYLVIRKVIAKKLKKGNRAEQEFEDEIDMYTYFCWCVVHGFCVIENEWFKTDSKNSLARLKILVNLATKTLTAHS